MSFPATRLSVVERTRSHDEETRRVAWATIIEAYWKPAYKYLRLKWSLSPDEAADLTQEFFTTTLEKEVVERYDPARARFRTYLRLCLDGFAANARKAERRLKRGGDVIVVPLDFQTAEGGPVLFEVFARYDLADEGEARATYARLAREMGLTVATVTNHLAAMRRQFRQIVLDRLRELTASEDEFEAEAARLLGTRSFAQDKP